MRSAAWLVALASSVAGCAILPLFEDPQGNGGAGGNGGMSVSGTGGTTATSMLGGNTNSFDGWLVGATAEPNTRVLFYDVDQAEAAGQIVVVGGVFPDPAVPNQELSLGGRCQEALLDEQSHLFVAFYELGGACSSLHVTEVAAPSDQVPIHVAHGGAAGHAFFTAVSLHKIESGAETMVVGCDGRNQCEVRDVVRDGEAVYAVGWQKRGATNACSGEFGVDTGREELVLQLTGGGCMPISLEHGAGTTGDQIAERAAPGLYISGRSAGGQLRSMDDMEVCADACSYFEDATGASQPVTLPDSRSLGRAAQIASDGNGVLGLVEVEANNGLYVFDGGGLGLTLPSGLPFSTVHANDAAATPTQLYGVGNLDESGDDPVSRLGFVLLQPRPINQLTHIHLFEPRRGEAPLQSDLHGIVASGASVVLVGNYFGAQEQGEVVMQLRELGGEASFPYAVADDFPLQSCASTPGPCRPFLARWVPPSAE